jgi:hypothetical protein
MDLMLDRRISLYLRSGFSNGTISLMVGCFSTDFKTLTREEAATTNRENRHRSEKARCRKSARPRKRV